MEKDRPDEALPVDEREGLILFFNVGNQVFGVRLTEIVRIEELKNAEKTDPVKKEELDDVIDLRLYFEIKSSGKKEEKEVLIVFDQEDEKYGMLVDSVEGILPAQEAPELNWPSHLDTYEAGKIFDGFFRKNEKLVPALNVAALKKAAIHENR